VSFTTLLLGSRADPLSGAVGKDGGNQTSCFETDVRYEGDRLQTLTLADTAVSCQEACMHTDDCSWFSYTHGICTLMKDRRGGPLRDEGAVAGPPSCEDGEVSSLGATSPFERLEEEVRKVRVKVESLNRDQRVWVMPTIVAGIALVMLALAGALFWYMYRLKRQADQSPLRIEATQDDTAPRQQEASPQREQSRRQRQESPHTHTTHSHSQPPQQLPHHPLPAQPESNTGSLRVIVNEDLNPCTFHSYEQKQAAGLRKYVHDT